MASSTELNNSPYLTEEWRKHAWNRETVSWLLSRHSWEQVEEFLESWDKEAMDGGRYGAPDTAVALPSPAFILNLFHAWAYGGSTKEDGWAEALLEEEDWSGLLVFIDSAAADGGRGRSASGRRMVRLFKHVLYGAAPLSEVRFQAAAPSFYNPTENTVEDLMRFYKNPTMPQSILRRDVDLLIAEIRACHDRNQGWALNRSSSNLGLLLAHATSMSQSTFDVFGKFLLKASVHNLGSKDPGARQLLMQVKDFPGARSSGVRFQIDKVSNRNNLFAISGYRFRYHTYDDSATPCRSSKCLWQKQGMNEDAVRKWWEEVEHNLRLWNLGLNEQFRGPFFCAGSPVVAKYRAALVDSWMARRTGSGTEASESLKTTELHMLPFMGVRLEGVYDALGDAAENIPASWLEELIG